MCAEIRSTYKEKHMSKSGTRKTNGQGHTYRNGKSYRTVINDKGRTVTASGKTAAESKRRAQEKLNALPIIAGSHVIRNGSMTVEQFILPWLENVHQQNIAETTYKRYLGLTKKYIIPGLGRVAMRNVTKKQVKQLMDSMALAGQKPRSIQQMRALLSVAFNYAVEVEMVGANPVQLVKSPKVSQGVRDPLDKHELKKLLDSVAGTFMCARIHIAAICGLRQGEALGLRWQDIDFESNAIHVRVQIQKKKGNRQFVPLKTQSSQRILYVGQATMDALKAHRAIINQMKLRAGSTWNDHDLVFPNRIGAPIQSKWDYERWMKALDCAGLRRRRLHDARHTAGTIMHESGADIESIRRVLGHSSIALTSSTYVHASAAPVRAAFESFEKAIDSA